MSNKKLKINHQIKAKEIRLIDNEGNQLGVVPIIDAKEMAKEKNLDLVEISPNATPPVVKILDYGKYCFNQEKKIKESKKKQKQLKLKEIRMQPKIDLHDLKFKTKHIQEFLDAGNKVKVTVRFRGRELAHTDRGNIVLNKVIEMLENINVEKTPQMEGRLMSMILNAEKKS